MMRFNVLALQDGVNLLSSFEEGAIENNMRLDAVFKLDMLIKDV